MRSTDDGAATIADPAPSTPPPARPDDVAEFVDMLLQHFRPEMVKLVLSLGLVGGYCGACGRGGPK